MAEFQIYRLRIFESDLFPLTRSRKAMLEESISRKPSLEPGSLSRLKVSTWHIGNVVKIDSDAFAFAIGKEHPRTSYRWDDDKKEFYTTSDDNAPFTIIVIDTKLELVGVMTRAGVASNDTIAQRLVQLLQMSDTFRNSGSRIVIEPLPDSNAFMAALREAFQVKRFIFHFYPPNPEDAEREIQKPLEDWLQRVHGNHGRTSIEGASLIVKELEPVARGSISAGSEVVAFVRQRRNSPKQTKISSKSKTVSTSVEDPRLEDTETLSVAIEEMRERYADNRSLSHDNPRSESGESKRSSASS